MTGESYSGVSAKIMSKAAKGKPRGKPFQKGVSGNPAGKPKGAVTIFTRDLKQAILEAAEKAGEAHGSEGTVSYLQWAAKEHPGPFMSLLGKVLPMQIAGTDDEGNPTRFVIDVVYPNAS